MIEISVQREDFDTGAILDRLAKLSDGAVASFLGTVRGAGGVSALELEHYPGMTEAALGAIAKAAARRWNLSGVAIVHRHGRLEPGERIVLAAAAAPHREAALEACAFLIDRLKTEAPFWKKEHFADGRSAWVEARDEDQARSAQWIGGNHAARDQKA